MPDSITEVFGIDKEHFDATGALDALLDVDTGLFVDPHLLDAVNIPELQGAHDTFREHFAKLLKVLRRSKQKGDPFWREADRLLDFPEVRGLCIGYGRETTAGSGMGDELRGRLLETAKAIVDAGIDDPEVFELIGLLEEGVGADRVSDMTARVIRKHLYAYSQRVFAELGVEGVETVVVEDYHLPKNPYSGKPVILAPKEILRPLPIAHDWGDVDIVCAENESLRRAVNAVIGETWRDATQKVHKRDLRQLLLEHPDLLKDLLAQYKGKARAKHDFYANPEGEAILHEIAVELVQQHPLTLVLSKAPTGQEVLKVVWAICDKFREDIEDHNGAKLLYRPNGQPQHEEFAQILFYMVADAYCEANNLDLSRESNAGRGPVDFKVAGGY
ncbi:MAG: hypothetical protein ACRD2L_01520, partial [Terriglobia bacterium]